MNNQSSQSASVKNGPTSKILGELKSSFENLTVQFENLKREIDYSRKEISSLKNRVHSLDSNESTLVSSLITNTVQELSMREKYKYNIIVYGLVESTSTNPHIIYNDDMTNLLHILSKLYIYLPGNLKLIRLSRNSNYDSSTPRPLKVIFQNAEYVSQIINDFRSAKHINSSNIPINIVRDKTQFQRENIRNCYQELNRRKQDGETNLVVSYTNGIHQVIKLL